MILDILARKPFWDRDLNFNHGTGHGVGYLLNIHEGPAGFRWKYRKGETEVLQEGMVITDEPGIYIEGSHGIRLENELLTCKGTLNEYGQFMYFEAITLIPMDLDAINPDIMTQEDKKLLNDYHAKSIRSDCSLPERGRAGVAEEIHKSYLTCEDGFFSVLLLNEK